ncbi:serine protease filzig [Polyergus mexicanus]|uniref:serine protease filzig n=1 Tax=Polyergus mexicanus TaxID=615972 RepID=UPI0038B68768
MRCTMAVGKSVCLLFTFLTLTCVSSHPWAPQNEGRKLFGGYTIVPKACRPSMPSSMKSSGPTICMFNYECTRRNGEVVGACMDGFLFGACCQLPPTSSTSENREPPGTEELLHLYQLDHVPDIPILLNPDGTPVGMSIPPSDKPTKIDERPISVSSYPDGDETVYTKISTSNQASSSTLPLPGTTNNAEKTQLVEQADVSHLAENFPALLGQQDIIDDLRLPGLLTHSDSNNNIQDHQDPSAVNPITTLLNPDQILQIADPVDQLPALFSQGLTKNNYSHPETILLNENGTMLEETNNPDEIFQPSTETSMDERITQSESTSDIWIKFPEQSASSTMEFTSTSQLPKSTVSVMPKTPMVTQMYTNTQKFTNDILSTQLTMKSTFEKVNTIEKKMSTKEATSPMKLEATTPMTVSSMIEELVKVQTITYDQPSGNKKKDDVLDKEELAINHIISILNDTTPKSEVSVTIPAANFSPVQAWVSIDETSKPSHVKVSSSNYRSTTPAPTTFSYAYYKPSSFQPSKLSSSYYNYELIPTETTYTQHSTSGSSFADEPTNPPAPTVIVLGPLGTEFSTKTTQKPVTWKPSGTTIKPISTPIKTTPLRPTLVNTKKPGVSTTITHNINTVISNAATNNVVSTSYISVNLKDGTNATPIVDVSTEAVVTKTGSTKQRPSTKKPVIWTTVSSWSNKPAFNMKPSTPSFSWSEDLTPVSTLIFKDTTNDAIEYMKGTTTTVPCEDETAAPDDLINFPPVRNPNLNISAPISQQEKPTIVEIYNKTGYPDIELISENDIPTPTFLEDAVLTDKVDAFVNKLVESLQGNFQSLKEVVYNGNGTTAATVVPSNATKRPINGSITTRRPTRKPTTRPSTSLSTTAGPTKRPAATTKRPTRTTQKPSLSEKPTRPTKATTPRPKPATSQNVTTKRPQVTTKRPKPTRKVTTVRPSSTETILPEEQSSTLSTTSESSNDAETNQPEFRTRCGLRPLVSRAGKIVGGKGAQFGEWPWQVLVREATWLGLFTKNKCGGVLITDKYVITAAHCQPGFLASLVAVFGEFDISGELESKRSITKNVRRVIVNRGYDPATFENDLALLELESPVQFDDHIVPICMPENGIDFTGRMATVTGWGRLKYNGGVPSVLQEVQVPIMENAVCQEMFQTGGHSKLILESFLCAGYANGQKDSCEGDSGGPLVMERQDGRWFLVGTVSHGIKCASPYLPGVYMRTTYFKPWLHSITGV